MREDARRSGHILDNDGLPQHLGHSVGEQSGHYVGSGTWSGWNDEFNCATGVTLSYGARDRKQETKDDPSDSLHPKPPLRQHESLGQHSFPL
jgi:hypothetical protein